MADAYTASSVCMFSKGKKKMSNLDPWTRQSIEEFFKNRSSPTQAQCDQVASSLTGAQEVTPVKIQGSLSYTLACTGGKLSKSSIIVSFRLPESHIDSRMLSLAREIHGDLVPAVEDHGTLGDSDDLSLRVCVMPLLPGISQLEAMSAHVDLTPEEEHKQINFTRHLAR